MYTSIRTSSWKKIRNTLFSLEEMALKNWMKAEQNTLKVNYRT